MSTDNRFALLEVEEVDVKQQQQTKNSPKTTGQNQPTPLERKKQKEQQQKKNPNPPPPKKTTTQPPPDFDDKGFIKVENKRERTQQPTEKKLSKQEFMNQKTGQTRVDNVKSPQQTRDDKPQGGSPQNNRQGGGGNYRSRANKNLNKNRGRIEDVNDKNPNRPDFVPNKKKFGEDKAPRKQGGVRTYEGNYRKKTQGGGGTGQTQSRGRVYDRKSGTGLDPNPKKNESGGENWGDPIKENLKAEEDKDESSSSSEYFPELLVLDEEGVEKKDNVVRKGYNTYLQKLEKEKQDLDSFLAKKNLKKQETVEAPKIKEDKIANLNKKITTEVPDKDSLIPTKPSTQEDNAKKPQETAPKKETEEKPVKKVVPVTQVFNVKTKKHRGINTIDQLERKTGGSPKQSPKDDSNRQDRQDDQNKADNKAKDNQTSWDDNKQENTKGKQLADDKQRRNDNYRGNNYNRDDDKRNQQPRNNRQKVGRGRFDIKSSNDFPSLSDNIEVPKPSWVPNTQTQ